MRIHAAVVEEKSGPFVIEEFDLDDPRPDEILVRIIAFGICQTDAHVRNQHLPTPLPVVLGHEGAGVVERVGSAVSSVSPGDHVVLSYQSCGHCPSCLTANAAYCDRALEANFSGAAPRWKGTAINTQETTREGIPDGNGKGAVTDEQVLVIQAKSGHSSAFGELYERHRLKIYRSAFRLLRNPQDAEDAVQQSFQRAFTNVNRFRENSAFATWMTRIAINEALMMLRRRRVTTLFLETNNDEIDLADDHPTPEQAPAEKESRAIVTHAISRLRKSLRTVAVLREMQGLSSAETARRLGLTVGAVKARTFHARRHLRKHLEGKYTARGRDSRT